ncbi:cell wall-active antibiotics response protein LiaF [Psychrobacillus sp. FSL H8-0483]|uniref:cell wall-active antibiotics response protein LiaF n=1 Tax=Psychrobacillus sp. FSL H8-0483 TaxID=2921389 RepID=UPI00315A0EF4
MKENQTNKLAFVLICFVFLMFIEATVFGNGNIVLVLLGIGMMYFSLRKQRRFLFWAGFILLLIAIFSMWSLRLFLIAIMLYALHKLWKNEPISQVIRPFGAVYEETPNSIIQNKLFSAQTTPFQAYEWQDIHVQSFYGEFVIDVTETVLPKGTSLISIRQSLGKVVIYVPYEIPVRLHYATILGEANILGRGIQRLWNQSVLLKDGYLEDVNYASELVISVSTWIGDIEVIRK